MMFRIFLSLKTSVIITLIRRHKPRYFIACQYAMLFVCLQKNSFVPHFETRCFHTNFSFYEINLILRSGVWKPFSSGILSKIADYWDSIAATSRPVFIAALSEGYAV